MFVFSTSHAGTDVWEFLNKHDMNKLISVRSLMSVKEAGLFSLQLHQVVCCKILRAIMPAEPTPWVNAVQGSPVLQQTCLLHGEAFPDVPPCPRQRGNASSMLP